MTMVVLSYRFKVKRPPYSLAHWENLRESLSMSPGYITRDLGITENLHRNLEPAVRFQNVERLEDLCTC